MNLLQFLKKEKGVRRIFGERELKIIEKQLWGVVLTQSEKNRLSRDVRKKFEFIEKTARFSDEFEIKKGAEVKRLVEETKEILIESKWFKKIKKIILFGSSAENQRSLRSDIDLAVEFDEIKISEATEFRRYIFGRANDRIDIQVYNILPEKIKKEIDEKGKAIYERKN
mgnify:CR=1 FL=1